MWDYKKAEFYIKNEATFNSAIRWDQRDLKFPEALCKEMVESISINNMLLYGCSLCSIEQVLGIIVFAGGESKIILNSSTTPTKCAQIAKDLNQNIIYNFIILFIIYLMLGIINGIMWAALDKSLTFFDIYAYSSPPMVSIIIFQVAIILFQDLVPISLYILLEIIQTIQAVFIYSQTLTQPTHGRQVTAYSPPIQAYRAGTKRLFLPRVPT